MTRHVRFSADRQVAPTITDASPAVRYGSIEGTEIFAGTERFPLSEVKLLPPSAPSKIVCVGRNYAEHARELGNEVPEEPLLFLKPPSSLIGQDDEIVYPALSKHVDFEGELGLVIGATAKHLTRENAMDAVRGYTIVNDLTARDLQKADKKNPWIRGKGFDTFCAVGPWIVPKDELRLDDVRIQTFVDDAPRQDGFARDMLFPITDILVYITQFMTLEPGDLIATGTPPGVGPVQPGAVIRIEVSGIGALVNRVVSQR